MMGPWFANRKYTSIALWRIFNILFCSEDSDPAEVRTFAVDAS